MSILLISKRNGGPRNCLKTRAASGLIGTLLGTLAHSICRQDRIISPSVLWYQIAHGRVAKARACPKHFPTWKARLANEGTIWRNHGQFFDPTMTVDCRD